MPKLFNKLSGIHDTQPLGRKLLVSHTAEVFYNKKTGKPIAVGWVQPGTNEHLLVYISGLEVHKVGRLTAVEILESLIEDTPHA